MRIIEIKGSEAEDPEHVELVVTSIAAEGWKVIHVERFDGWDGRRCGKVACLWIWFAPV